MLSNSLWENVLVKYEKLTSNAAPGIQDAQASIIMTNAQMMYVHSRVAPMMNPKREGLEETEVRMQGLGNLITPVTISTFTTGTFQNSVYVELPLDFMYNIFEEVIIDQDNCITNEPARINVDVVSHNEYNRGILDPYKRPYFDGTEGVVWRMTYDRQSTGYASQTTTSTSGYTYITGQTGKRFQLITDGSFNITNYIITYLRLPKDIIITYVSGGNQQNCELDEPAQWAIIDIAVGLLKKAMEQPNQEMLPNMQQIE